MEQTRYWMWAKRKQPDSNPHILVPSPPVTNPYGDSWEEQAFAEDAAAGSLGGCVWPPRSYSCSFCRREFRSAQALGGHMNVHRRDRARMKQLSPPEVVPQNHALNHCTSSFHDSSQISTFLYRNPNPEFSDSSSLIRVSSPLKKVNDEEMIKTTTLSFFSPVVQKKDIDNIIRAPSWSSFVTEKRKRAFDLIANEEKKSGIVELDSRVLEKQDCVITEDLSMSLNLDFFGTKTNKSSDEEIVSCKRRRIEASPLSTLPKLSAVERCNILQSSVEELDLELRLGDAPKVK